MDNQILNSIVSTLASIDEHDSYPALREMLSSYHDDDKNNILNMTRSVITRDLNIADVIAKYCVVSSVESVSESFTSLAPKLDQTTREWFAHIAPNPDVYTYNHIDAYENLRLNSSGLLQMSNGLASYLLSNPDQHHDMWMNILRRDDVCVNNACKCAFVDTLQIHDVTITSLQTRVIQLSDGMFAYIGDVPLSYASKAPIREHKIIYDEQTRELNICGKSVQSFIDHVMTVKDSGILIPIILGINQSGNIREVVSGEIDLLSAQCFGLPTVPAIVVVKRGAMFNDVVENADDVEQFNAMFAPHMIIKDAKLGYEVVV